MLAVALSAIWPGLGHFGHRNGRALVLVAGTLGVVAIGFVYTMSQGARTLLVWGLAVSTLRLAIGLSLCVLVLRAVIAVDAYRTAVRGRLLPLRYLPRPRSRSARLGSLVVLTMLAAVIAAPHFLVIRFATAQMTLLSDVFDTTEVQTAIPTPISATTVAIAPGEDISKPPAKDDEGPMAESSVPPSSPPPSATPTTAPVSTWDGAARLTVALLGSDAGFDRFGVRTDTIIVLSIDTADGKAVAFSIPRNWHYVKFPEGTPASELWPDGFPGIVNEIYGLGLTHPETFPGAEDTAGQAIKSALAQLTGLNIQYYVLVDMVGFVEVIDLFGGIDLYVSESINDRIKPIVPEGPSIDIVVEPGEYHFDGLTALGYVRSRVQSTDWHRMTRQRCVVAAMIDQVPLSEVIYRYVDLTEIISAHVSTDIPLDRLDELLDLAEKLDTSRMVSVNFIPPEFQPGDAPIGQVRQAVIAALQDDADQTKAILSDSCRGPRLP